MKTLIMVVCAALLLQGCGSAQKLASRPAAVPAGIDLSGQWVLQSNAGSNQRAARETAVYAFFESGKSVKITQTKHGLFLSFDRSVVEEYRFGENRTVSIGEVSAQRVSGWAGDSYVIETLDDDGAHLIDTYRLANDGQSLERSVSIRSKNRQQMSITQKFDRTIGG
ncbi:MAG: hypothetical protein KJO82_03565 [Gammaproteobacteria bacterium]|nr:hypothetical protein [Gammaproteobacteria bacterium]